MTMKPFAKRLLAAASAAAIAMSTIPAVGAAEFEDQTWPMLRTISEEEQIPALDSIDPITAPLTRLGMAQLVMDSYRTVTGASEDAPVESEMVFLDTEDADVLSAYQLDLVNGRTAGRYEPMEAVSRQDFLTASAMLLESIGYPYVDDILVDLSDYADGDQVLAYATQPVRALLCLQIIEPNDDNCLEPARNITVEEAMKVLDRLVSFYSEWELDPVEPQRYLGEEVAEYALNYVGCRYVRGGQGPKKFDCSGFVYYVYKHFGYSLKPGARNQWSILSKSVKKADLLPGDLVFFSNSSRASGIFHVGIYIGDGQFVHAANSRKGVIVTDMDDAWYANRYLGAKRAIR